MFNLWLFDLVLLFFLLVDLGFLLGLTTAATVVEVGGTTLTVGAGVFFALPVAFAAGAVATFVVAVGTFFGEARGAPTTFAGARVPLGLIFFACVPLGLTFFAGVPLAFGMAGLRAGESAALVGVDEEDPAAAGLVGVDFVAAGMAGFLAGDAAFVEVIAAALCGAAVCTLSGRVPVTTGTLPFGDFEGVPTLRRATSAVNSSTCFLRASRSAFTCANCSSNGIEST
jgi:hypothetical protein